MVDRLRRVPVWAWLAVIVAGSFALRAWLVRDMVGPFIMVDELIYSELARSVAAGEGFQVRDVPAAGFSLVYPLLISPAYALFDALPDAYAAVKTLNALFMSLAAVPAYLLARRVLAPGLSLAAAVLTLAVPSFAYTGTVMTENVFFPLFLTTALMLVLVLEQPTWRRQLALFGLVILLFATRVQAVAFVPAIVVAPLFLAWLGRRPLRQGYVGLRVLYGLFGGTAALLLTTQLARGQSITNVFGAYAVVGDTSYDPATVARFFLYHLAELDLYLGVLPFAAFALLILAARRLEPAVAPFLAAGLALTAAVLLVVAAFASVFANRIQERNTFVVAPFFLIALLVWVDRGGPRQPRVLAVGAVIACALLPLAIPWGRFIETSATSDTLALLPIWSAYGSLLLDSINWTVLAGGAVAAGLMLLIRRRWLFVLPMVTLLFLLTVSYNVWSGEHGFRQASTGAVFQGIRVGQRDWIDRALPAGQQAAFVWSGVTDRFVVNQNEFFNRSVGPIYYLGGPTPGGLAETELTVDERTGVLHTRDGRPVEPAYVLTEDKVAPDGRLVARDPGLGITLWRISGPLVATATVIDGLYPNDTWSGAEVTWSRQRCRGGTLTVMLSSDPELYDDDQVVTARVSSKIVGQARVPPVGSARLGVPLTPDVDGACVVAFEVGRTRVPGDGDDRALGVHFDTFGYAP